MTCNICGVELIPANPKEKICFQCMFWYIRVIRELQELPKVKLEIKS